jgi:hypothetical protein
MEEKKWFFIHFREKLAREGARVRKLQFFYSKKNHCSESFISYIPVKYNEVM